MGREIKFRAYHNGFNGEDAQMLHSNHPLDACRWAAEGQDIELMQYTGLKDKNGVEVYEGDILKDINLCDQDQHGILVSFKNNAWCFDHKNYHLFGEHINDNWIESLKVVGNIHENKDLLND